MGVWDCLGSAATVAQLVGVDTVGLVSMILTAVQTARQNRKECQQLACRVLKIADLLQKLQRHDRARDESIWRPLDGLDDTLQDAYVLVASCQDSSATYRFFMGWKQSDQFRQVQKKIDGYIELYPFVMHLDITQRLDRLSDSARTEGSTIEESRVQPTSEPSEGREEAGGMSSTRKRRSIWRCCRPCEGKRTAPCIPGFIHHGGRGYFPFRLSQLAHATNNFSSKGLIGSGGFGTVYKGRMRGGLEVAVKRCGHSRPSEDIDELFRNQIQIHMKLCHKNIVNLMGYCSQKGEMILVYEYIPNRSLDRFLFDPSRTPLDWSIRIKIIKELIPSGAEVEGLVRGTMGYIAPERLRTGKYSVKDDVYSFGVMLVEIIAGKRCIVLGGEELSRGGYFVLQDYARELWSTGRASEIIDPSLRNEDDMTEILRCIQIGLVCTERDRPSMWDVLLMLYCENVTIPTPQDRIIWQTQNESQHSSQHSSPSATSTYQFSICEEEDNFSSPR